MMWNQECLWDCITQGDYSPLSPVNFPKSARACGVPEREGAGGSGSSGRAATGATGASSLSRPPGNAAQTVRPA